ncbi:MAG TPA: hypothetical protein VGE98_16020 [Thermoanaerobaculia bacterium]
MARVAAASALALALLACGGARESAPAQAPKLTELHSIADLSAAFDRDAQHPRLVLLLSPT